MILNIDPVNYCPLKCPSCPTGRRIVNSGPIAYLQPEQLGRILYNVTKQEHVNILFLFNFFEPFLNSKLPDIVRIGKEYVPYTEVSTSGNVHGTFDLADLIDANPKKITIGTSGWSQEVYSSTHVGGDVEKVKQMMVDLHDKKAGKMVWVIYHRYDNNLHEEENVRKFAKKLGFNFRANWATHINIENIMDGTGSKNLVVPMQDQLNIVKNLPNIPCGIWDQFSITPLGYVKTCCSSIDYMHFAGNIFVDSLETIKGRMKRSAICARCIGLRANYIACGPVIQIDKACARNVGHSIKYLVERTRKRVWSYVVHKRSAA